jgi:hypothetical protein
METTQILSLLCIFLRIEKVQKGQSDKEVTDGNVYSLEDKLDKDLDVCAILLQLVV